MAAPASAGADALHSADSQALVAAAPVVPVREIFRRFWPDARPYRAWFAVLAGPRHRQPGAGGDRRSGCSSSSWTRSSSRATSARSGGSPAIYVGLTLLGAIVGFADDYLSAWVGERFLLGLRTRVFAHLQGLSLERLRAAPARGPVARLTGDVAAIESFVLAGVADAINYVALHRVLRRRAVLLELAPGARVADRRARLLADRAAASRALIKLASREKRRRSGSISAVAEESLGDIALVQAYGREDARGRALRTARAGQRTPAEMAADAPEGAVSPR